jgi:hypothetical protein
MNKNFDSNLSSSQARHLGELDSQTGHQKSFQGGNDEVASASVEPCNILTTQYLNNPLLVGHQILYTGTSYVTSIDFEVQR